MRIGIEPSTTRHDADDWWLMMASGTNPTPSQHSLFGSDSEEGNSQGDPLDKIALSEFQMAVVKEEDNLSKHFTTLNAYNERQ